MSSSSVRFEAMAGRRSPFKHDQLFEGAKVYARKGKGGGGIPRFWESHLEITVGIGGTGLPRRTVIFIYLQPVNARAATLVLVPGVTTTEFTTAGLGDDCSIIDTRTCREVARPKVGKEPKRLVVVSVPEATSAPTTSA